MRFAIVIMTVCLSLFAAGAHGLSSDRNKPATIEADEVEFDFRTGKRTYTGDVLVIQGTLKVTGDKMVVQYDQSGNQIETATSYGNPATFKQRPDGKEHDVYGEGQTIILNEVENTLTLIKDAVMTQAGNTAKGKEIVYDMATDKMTVKSATQRQETADAEGAEDEEAEESDSGRARVVITPEEQQSAGDGGDAQDSGQSAE